MGTNTIVVTSDTAAVSRDSRCVRTMLDLIRRIERADVVRVVLTDAFARDPQLVEFLHDTYPGIDVVMES
jgi:hypothetical protein